MKFSFFPMISNRKFLLIAPLGNKPQTAIKKEIMIIKKKKNSLKRDKKMENRVKMINYASIKNRKY